MILLDIRTLVFSNVVTDIICLLVIFLLWHQSRKRFAGSGFWVFDFAFQTAAMFLIILRGSIPDWMSIVLANTLVIGGAILGYMGLGGFVGKKASQLHNYVLLAAFASVHAYFSFVQPSLAARNLNVSAGLLIICFQCMWFLVYRVEPGLRQLTRGVGMVFGAYCLVSITRIVEVFTGMHPANDFFQTGSFDSLVFISYQVLFILLTYSLVLMVNKRLLGEVKTQEEKFAKAFHSSPYAITLTRLSDGQIIEVNDSFLNITGYRYEEVVGKTTVDLHLWDKEEDRVVIVEELSKSGKVQGREFQYRKKSGELITGLFSAEIIPIHNQEFILSSISDITERKRAEEALRKAHDGLEMRVQERTSELSEAVERLRVENVQRQRLEDILRESENQVRFFASQCLTAQETERKRVADELHDGIAASLGTMRVRMDKITEEMKQGHGNPESLQDLASKMTEINHEVRRIMADLRPSILDDLGVIAAMNWFCREYEKAYSHLSVEKQFGISEPEVPDSMKTPIFRISQEAMNNIAKHSRASLVNLSLRRKDDKVLLTIQDNGQGFDLDTARKGLGLSTMKERARLSGGSFDLESAPGKGTLIRVSWPLLFSRQ